MYRTILVVLSLFLISIVPAMAATPVDVADLTISGTDSPDPVNPGGDITYTITATNNGPDGANQVFATIVLGSGLSYVSDSAGCFHIARFVKCSIGNMGVGSQVFNVTVHVDSAATGSVSSDLGIIPTLSWDPNLDNNKSSISTTIDVFPTANDDSYTVDEDSTLNQAAPGVLGNDSDSDGPSALTAILMSNPASGVLNLNADGSFDYTPDSNFNGSVSFTYKSNDGVGDSNTATVSITVNSINDNPTAADDSATTLEDTEVTVSLLDNDSDVEGDSLAIQDVGLAGNGTVTNNNDGTVTYSPNTGFFGGDSFTYTINDGNGGSATATVNITVDEVAPDITISIDDASKVEPLTGSVNATLTISLSEQAGSDVTVDFATADGTATEGSDYTGNTGIVTIMAGSTSATVTIEILADADSFELNQTILVNLSNANGATIHDGEGTITISETCLYCDDFEDSVTATDWTYIKSSWLESNGFLSGTSAKRRAIAVANPVFTGCTNCSINTAMSTMGGARNRLSLYAWFKDKKNTVELQMKEESDKWLLRHRVGGKIVSKVKGLAVIQPNVSYSVDLSFDGTNFVVRIDGQTLITMPAAATVPNGTVGFGVRNTTGNFAHILVN